MSEIQHDEKKSYVLGAIGALLGGIICSIPWAIVQAYLDMVSSILACLIGFGAFKSYQILKGKSGPPAKWIIIFAAVFAVFVGQCEAICVMLLRNNAAIIDVNIKYMLTHSTLVTIVFNLILGLAMALIGTLPVSSFYKNDTNCAAGQS